MREYTPLQENQPALELNFTKRSKENNSYELGER